MTSKLYVGGISYSASDEDLKDFFASAGTVVSASVITDRETGRSKGFGFVEMSSDEDAANAIETLNGKDMMGRAIKVSEARPQEKRTGDRGGFSGGRGRY
jgi:RNA recognition motif-containing protein